jgi:hypothetical protein
LSPNIDSFALFKNPVAVIWFLYFYEYKRHTVNKHGYIRTELIFTVLVSELGANKKAIIIEIFKVNQLYTGHGGQSLEKGSS